MLGKNNMLTIHKKLTKPKQSIVFDTYWRFAAERQQVFFNRIVNPNSPWTDDVILRLFKFTNAYRASDRVSQYLIKEVIYKGDQSPNELFFRIILFKLFNKIETWQVLERELGVIRYSEFSFSKYDKLLTRIKKINGSIYSAAYIMASGKSAYGKEYKHQNHLMMLESMMGNQLPQEIMNFRNMQNVYNGLKKYPSIGSFLAYQLAIDINYSNLTDFTEMEFVKAGPGAVDGIRKCFTHLGDYSEEDVIKIMADTQEREFKRLGISFLNLWGRPLQLIDCQNLFCEVDKYSRIAHPEINGVSGRSRIKQKYRPTSLRPIDYFFPPKWKLNTAVLPNLTMDQYG